MRRPDWQSGDGTISLYLGDCLEILPGVQADACVCDPPYGLEFMGKEWDRLRNNWQAKPGTYHNDTTFLSKGDRIRYQAGTEAQSWHQQWSTALLSALPPAAYALIFGGTRTYHRLACAVEDAGFEIRDCLMWLYGSGFPKGKGCLKPAYEPILLARKPGAKVGALGIDECRVGTDLIKTNECSFAATNRKVKDQGARPYVKGIPSQNTTGNTHSGRWPANLLHDGSEEVLEAFAAFGEAKPKAGRTGKRGGNGFGFFDDAKSAAAFGTWPADGGGTAARFFYTAKASRKERGEGNSHPTVKPLALMSHLVKLVAREGQTVVDPFLGSGTTGVACVQTGRRFVGIEKEPKYFEIAKRRIVAAMEQPTLALEAS